MQKKHLANELKTYFPEENHIEEKNQIEGRSLNFKRDLRLKSEEPTRSYYKVSKTPKIAIPKPIKVIKEKPKKPKKIF